MRHSPAARRAARQLPPAQLRASAASKSLNVRGNGDGDAARLLHDWLKADLTCALVPPLYRWQFRRALDAMQRCRVEEAACRPAEEARGFASQQVPGTMFTQTAACAGAELVPSALDARHGELETTSVLAG